jgi:hypothetical protein
LEGFGVGVVAAGTDCGVAAGTGCGVVASGKVRGLVASGQGCGLGGLVGALQTARLAG